MWSASFMRRLVFALCAAILAAGSPATAQSALRQAAAARAFYSEERANQTRVYIRLLDQFRSSQEYQDALDRLTRAQRDFDAVKSELAAGLRANPDYLALTIQRDQEEQELERIRQETDGDANAVTQQAKKLLQIRQAISVMESAAANASTKLADSRVELVTAYYQVVNQWQDFERSIQSDPEWREATARVAAAANNMSVAAVAAERQRSAEWEKNRQRMLAMIGYP